MPLPITPHMLAAAYEYLRTTPPFARWKLPHADEVEFCVTAHRDREGDHCTYRYTGGHVIRVSTYHIKTTDALMQVMAHEMVHALQHYRKTTPKNRGHNSEFKRLSARICAIHGWNRHLFTL